MFTLRPRPQANVIALRAEDQRRVDEQVAANRERLAREDRELRVAFALAMAVICLASFGTMALLVWSERCGR